jgi:hypothetical protein
MEASVVERERALQSSPVFEQPAAQRGYGVLLPLAFLCSVLALYLVSGYAIYVLVAALT